MNSSQSKVLKVDDGIEDELLEVEDEAIYFMEGFTAKKNFLAASLSL